MLTYEDFNTHVEAHLLFALDLPHAEGVRIFERRLQDGSWRAVPSVWANKLGVLAYRASASGSFEQVRRLVVEFVAVITRCVHLDNDIREVLVPILRINEAWTQEATSTLALWFARVGEPGDAGLAADMLDVAGAEMPAAMTALALWLIDHGASELRARSRLRLALRLVQLVRRTAEPLVLLAAVRYVLENTEKIDMAIGSYQPHKQPEVAALIEAIELLLDTKNASPQIVADLARKYVDFAAGELLFMLAESDKSPCIRRASLFALAQGLLPPSIAKHAWRRLIGAVPAESSIEFANRECVVPALCALTEHAASDRPSGHEGSWATVIANELLRFRDDLRREDLADIGRAVGFPGHEALDKSVQQALLGHLVGRNALAASMLQSEFSKSGAILATLRLFTVSDVKRRSSKLLEEDVATRVEAMLRSQTPHRYGELRERLAACRHVAFEERLDSEFKVRLGQDVLRVDRDAVTQLLDAGLDHLELVVAGVLYVIHEVVHVCQHIDDKEDVARLRATGAETTLMHVDLGADHVAAMVVHAAMPEWSVRYLKDVVGRSLSAFPTASHHTTAARSRKANRLVGARLDFLAREVGALHADADEYAFAEYGPAGGDIILMRSGPPWSLMGVAPLGREDARLLVTAADHGLAGLGRVDDALRNALNSVTARSTHSESRA